MAFSFDQIFAADPANPQNVASNAAVLIYQPGDPTKTPLVITDPSGGALSNPVIVNANGFGSAFMHATLDRVAWDGGTFSGFFTSYEGMKNEAVDARTAAQEAAATAGADAAAVATAAIGTATDEATAAAADAATAQAAAAASATAAANAAALVGAPADSAIAAAVNGTGTATKAALNATYATTGAVTSAVTAEQVRAEAAYARAGAVVRPLVKRAPSTSTTLTNGGGAAAGTGTLNLADTTDFVLGSSSVKLTSGGAGGFRFWQIAPSITDFTAKTPRIVFKIPDYTNVNEAYLYLGDSAMTNYWKANLDNLSARDTQKVSRQGEWSVLDIARSDFTAVGAPDWANIQLARVYITDKNATATTIQINSIGAVADPTGLPNGAAVFTFDDSDATHYTKAKPYLDKYGAPGVSFPILSNIGGAGLSIAQLQTMRDMSGWEIGGHAWDTAEHTAGFIGLTAADVRTKFDRIKTQTASYGFTADNFAWPNGDCDAVSEAVAREYWSTARGTQTGIQPATWTKPMRLKGVGDATFSNAIAKAKASKSVAIFVIHRIVASAPTGNDVLESNFQAAVDACIAQGVPIMTLNGVLKATGSV